MEVNSQLCGAGSSSSGYCFMFHRCDLARTSQRGRSAGDGGLSIPVMRGEDSLTRQTNQAEASARRRQTRMFRQASKASSCFIPNGFCNHLNNTEDLEPSLICSYFCGKKVERSRGLNPHSARASAVSARVNAEAFIRYFHDKSFPLLSKEADQLPF